MPDPKPTVADAARAGLLVAALELALVRLTSVPPTLPSALLSLGAWPVLGAGLTWAIRRAPRLGVVAPGLACGLGITAFAASDGASPAWNLAAPLAALGVSRFPRAGAAAALAPVAAAALAGWLARYGRLPDLATLAVFAGLVTVLAAASTRARASVGVSALVVVLACASRSSPVGALPPRSGTGPDLILVTIDTLRADAAAGMSSMQRLAARGTTYTAARASGPWTLPSMGSLLTGLPAEEHGAARTKTGILGIADEVPTLAESLQQAGYHTVAIVASNPNIGPSYGFTRGFDAYEMGGAGTGRFALPRNSSRERAQPVLALATMSVLYREAAALRVTSPPIAVFLRRAIGWFEPPLDDAALVARALTVTQRRPKATPLFLWIHLLDPHWPYLHAAELPDPSGTIGRVILPSTGHQELAACCATGPARAALDAVYANEVAHTDRALAALLDGLPPAAARGRIIAFTADHGEELFDHGGFEHGHTLFEELLHVPLIVAHEPDAGEPRRVDTPVPAWGVAQLFRGEALPSGPVVSRNLLYGPADAAQAIVDGRWKLISGAEDRLYDLSTDPQETTNVAGAHPELVDALRARLPTAGRTGTVATPTDEELKLLRALGYLGE